MIFFPFLFELILLNIFRLSFENVVDVCDFYRRISHRTHHQNHGHVENDESWVPVSASLNSHCSFHF